MIDVNKSIPIIEGYKEYFPKHWEDEKYKWKAIKHFQDNWDIKAEDFAQMLNRSLGKSSNLLASINNYPKRMIIEFARIAPEEVRAMFADLYDYSKDVYVRMESFKAQSAILLEKYKGGTSQHYQHENAISTYLWLRYPDKYYIYKFSEVKSVANELGLGYLFKKGAYEDNIRNFLRLYDEISAMLKEYNELVDLFKSRLTDDCYPDSELKTLAVDFGFYISRFYSRDYALTNGISNWYGTEYDPNLSVDDWTALLKDENVFTTDSLEIMKRMKDYGGAATCTQLSAKYGKTMNFYNAGCSAGSGFKRAWWQCS